jgi:hypothetical protein
MKRVTFNSCKKVRYYYYLKIYYDDIWWSCGDYEDFLKSALDDIKRLKRIHGGITLHEARKLLYQTKITYDESNFS